MTGPSTWTSLFDLAAELLTACDQALALSPGGAIARSYIAPGPPAWDCEEVTVHVGSVLKADTLPLVPPLSLGHRIEKSASVNLVPLVVTVLRCTPSVNEQGRFPSASEIETASQVVLGDIWAIWNHVQTLIRQKKLFQAPSCSREVFAEPMVPLRPSGGLAGFEQTWRISLEGFPTVAP